MSWGQAQPPPACVSCCHVPSMCSLLVHGENPANAPKVKDKLLVRDHCAIFCHGWESQIFQKEMSKYGWLRQFSSSDLSCSIILHSYPILLGIPNATSSFSDMHIMGGALWWTGGWTDDACGLSPKMEQGSVRSAREASLSHGGV